MTDITLGAAVRDLLTGFEGIVIARIDHLFSGRTYLVQARAVGPDGRPVAPVELVTERLRVVQRDALHQDLADLFNGTDRDDQASHER